MPYFKICVELLVLCFAVDDNDDVFVFVDGEYDDDFPVFILSVWFMLFVRTPVRRDVQLRFHGNNITAAGSELLVVFPEKLFKNKGSYYST